ncbi:hypothetical protein RFI_02183 [Reticulomyxa filosa]|uniref:Uncharacterized protein n=1 Tax=Reticulomyxa filosa TaxID=46433 RepID=X6P8R1_RETFI|nr:hypothetical protein RFI_02183 [Reticulomyxa filosa]|eukprot:ETO34900.1 hypothetical protein RFI_02183 [Reticulomyxa filosa]
MQDDSLVQMHKALHSKNEAERINKQSLHCIKLCNLNEINESVAVPNKHEEKGIGIHNNLFSCTINEDKLEQLGIRSLFKMVGVKFLPMIDMSSSVGTSKTLTKRILPACAQIPEATGAILFGDDVSYIPLGSIKTPSAFQVCFIVTLPIRNKLHVNSFWGTQFTSRSLQNGRNLLSGFMKLSDVIFEDFAKSKEKATLEAYQKVLQNNFSSYITKADLTEFNQDKPLSTVQQLCKSMVKCMLNQACHIAEAVSFKTWICNNNNNKKKTKDYMYIKQKGTWDAMLLKKTKQQDALMVSQKDNVYVVVLFVCGNDTTHQREEIEKASANYAKFFKANCSDLKILCKVVSVGTETDLKVDIVYSI